MVTIAQVVWSPKRIKGVLCENVVGRYSGLGIERGHVDIDTVAMRAKVVEQSQPKSQYISDRQRCLRPSPILFSAASTGSPVTQSQRSSSRNDVAR